MTGTAGDSGHNNALSILVVDDNPDVRTVLARFLTQKGFRVTALADGLAAAKLFDAALPAFDAVLMDIQLPGMSGRDVLHQIRAQDHLAKRHTPVLALTGAAHLDGDREFDALLRKPFPFESLVPRILNAIEQPTQPKPK